MTFMIECASRRDPTSEAFPYFATVTNSRFRFQPEPGRIEIGRREFTKQIRWNLHVKILVRDPRRSRWQFELGYFDRFIFLWSTWHSLLPTLVNKYCWRVSSMYDLGTLDILSWERKTFGVYWSFNGCIVLRLRFPHYIGTFLHNL